MGGDMTKKFILKQIQERISRAKHIIKHTNECPRRDIIISHYEGEIWGLRSLKTWVRKNES